MHDLPLKQLGDYRIEARIGSGGMGIVYRAHDERLDRTVAIKTLSPELASDQQYVAHFRGEAAAAARVHHPNVVPIHFIGREGDLAYFVMQYVEGESLARRLARRRLILEEAVGLAEQCLAGLAAAHAMGVVHRDVKPANILLDSETGRPLLVDFGLARRVDQGAATPGAAILGTVDYLSPEQALGREADQRSDVYSMGAVFYQMLSGRLPFEADTSAAMIYLHAYESPRPVEQLAPGVPAELGHVVAGMMAKNPAERYASCEEVLDALRSVRASHPRLAASRTTIIFAAPEPEDQPEAAMELPSWAAGRWQGLRNLAATCFRRHAPEFLQQLQSTSQQVDAAVGALQRRRDRLAKLLSEARAVDNDLAEQVRANAEALAASAREQAAAAPEAADQRRQCQENLAALESLRRQQREELEEIELQAARAEASLAGLRARRDALKARLRAAEVRQRIEGGWQRIRRRVPWKRIAAAAFFLITLPILAVVYWPKPPQPNRYAEILAARKPAPKAAEAPPQEKREHLARTLGGHTGWVRAVAFSPDGTLLASAGQDQTVLVREVPGGAVRHRLSGHLGEVCALAFSPKGNLMASFSRGGKFPKDESDPARPDHSRKVLILWNLADGRLQAKVDMPREPSIPKEPPDSISHDMGTVYPLAISPDGTTVACSGWSLSTALCDTAGGTLRRSLLPPVEIPSYQMVRSYELLSTAFSRDGATLATGGRDGVIRLWDPATGRLLRELPRTLPSAREGVCAMAFHPDGTTLAAAYGTAISLWDTATWTQRPAPGRHAGSIQAVVFSADGSLMASVSQADPVVLRDGKTGRPCLDVGLGRDFIYNMALSPDGSLLATAGQDGRVQLWNVPKSLESVVPTIVAQSPPGRAATARPTLAENELARLEGHGDGVGDVQFLPGGKQLVSAGADRTVRLWDLGTHAEVLRLVGFAGPVDGVAVAPDGKQLLMCDGANGLVLWDIASGRAVRRFEGHYNRVRCVRFFPDGQTAVSGGEDGRAITWDVRTGTDVDALARDAPIHAVAVSRRDFQAAATFSTSKIAATWRTRRPGGGNMPESVHQFHETVRGCALHPWADPPMVFSSAGDDHADAKEFGIRLWSSGFGSPVVRHFVGHTAAPMALDVSGDGALLVSGGADKTVRLWDVERAEEVCRFDGHAATVRAVAFSPDAGRVASGSSDGTVRIWRVPEPGSLRAAATAARKTAVRSAAIALVTFDSDSNLETGNQRLFTDSSEAGNHFSAPKSASFRLGRVEAAVLLDNAALRLPRTLLCGRTAYSLAFWVRPRKTDAPMTLYREEGSPGGASASGTIFRVGLGADGSVEIEANRPGATVPAASVRSQAGSVPPDRWTFIGLSLTGGAPARGALTLWINDKPSAHVLQAADHPQPAATSLGPAPADLDELMVFDRGLSDEEIRTIYVLGVNGRSLVK